MLGDGTQADRQSAIRRSLGYPDCCSDFYGRIQVDDRLIDATWWMAAGTEHTQTQERTAEVKGSHLSNLMWHLLDVRAVPHFPCSFVCPETIALGRGMLETGRRTGYADEVAWLEEILSWPVQWTALHGIAEVKTPVLRLIANTDPTPVKYTVRLHGTTYPEEGARGLAFPYQLPVKLMQLAHPGPGDAAAPR
jgi:hypothetical protein